MKTKLRDFYLRRPSAVLGFLLFLMFHAVVAVAHPASTIEKEIGTVAGVVVDVSGGQALANAAISVVGTSLAAQSDPAGNFVIKLEPGTYQLRITRTGFQGHLLSPVLIRPKEVTNVEVALSPEGMTLGEVVVTADSSAGGTEIALLAERRASGVVSDAISAREMSRDTSSNAAGVLQRVVGVSVVQDKFVYVRGLGERYSNTVLNDALLPTTEPDRRVVPMDLMPANMLDNVKIFKTFTPDQPGEFAGGARQNPVEGISCRDRTKGYYIVWVQHAD